MPYKQLTAVATLALRRKLSAYPTSLEKDREWLARSAGHSRKKLAVELRMSEKTIIMDWINHFNNQTKSTTPSDKTSPKKKTKKRKTT